VSEYDLIVAAIATWYLSYVITAQTGPFLIFEKLRQSKAGGLFSCIYCTSPYVAGGIYAAMRCTSWGITLAQILAIAGAALMLRSYTGAGMHDV
jgi:hypothetical protein